MIDKLNHASATTRLTKARTIARTKRSANIDKKADKDQTINDKILSEIVNEGKEINKETVKHKLIIHTLIAQFGEKASQEPEFNEMYKYIDRSLSENKETDTLLEEIIESRKKIQK